MSSETASYPESLSTPTRLWGGAAASGIFAGVGMGLIMHYVMNAMPLIGGLYGQPSVAIGWVAHLFHSVVFALLFVAVITRTRFRGYGIAGITGLGALYGIVLEIGAAGVVLPLWANAMGLGPLPVPFLLPIGFLTHIVYGVLLGGAFGYLYARDRSPADAGERVEETMT